MVPILGWVIAFPCRRTDFGFNGSRLAKSLIHAYGSKTRLDQDSCFFFMPRCKHRRNPEGAPLDTALTTSPSDPYRMPSATNSADRYPS